MPALAFPATLRRVGLYGLLFAASLLACSRILVLHGWPQNHDGVACFQMVEIFRRALAQGNLLPLWTPLAENGYGSPFPFFYHRLFNTLAGAIALATGSTYAAVKIVIPLLLFTGALGMRRALLAMGLGPLYAVSGALLLVFSNYAYTDWVVRGAFAEFAAFMLLPWLTLAALRIVEGKPRAGWGLGVALSLTFFAHSAIFVFAFALVVVAFAGALVFSGTWQRALANLSQAACVVVPVTGPFLLGIWLFGKDVDMDRFQTGMFSVFRNFAPLEEYFYDRLGGWTWSTAGYSVEIGRGFNTLAILSFAAVAAGLAHRRLSATRFREMRPAWFLVVGSAAIYFFLQTPLAAPVYRLVPPLRYIGFPWRLLTFSTTASIVILCLSLDLLEASWPRPAIRSALRATLFATVLFQVWYGIGRSPTDRILGTTDIEASFATERLARTVHHREFRPRGVPLPPPRPFLEVTDSRVSDASPRAALDGIVDVPELRLVVDAAPGGTLVINQFANPFLIVGTQGAARVGTTARGTILVQLPPGRSEIVLRRRGLLAALGERLSGRRAPSGSSQLQPLVDPQFRHL